MIDGAARTLEISTFLFGRDALGQEIAERLRQQIFAHELTPGDWVDEQKLAEQYHTQLLGQMPLHISLREDLDRGTPTVISRPDSEFTAIYRDLAGRVAAQLYWQGEVIPGEIAFRAV